MVGVGAGVGAGGGATVGVVAGVAGGFGALPALWGGGVQRGGCCRLPPAGGVAGAEADVTAEALSDAALLALLAPVPDPAFWSLAADAADVIAEGCVPTWVSVGTS